MGRLESVVQTTSLGGVQYIWLLRMYALNNPSSGLSLWPLHYHGLGQMIELCLQRNVPGKVFTVFEEQMRTRIFWCSYTIDHLLSTLMGRPIGVVDEQCDLRVGRLYPPESLTMANLFGCHWMLMTTISRQINKSLARRVILSQP